MRDFLHQKPNDGREGEAFSQMKYRLHLKQIFINSSHLMVKIEILKRINFRNWTLLLSFSLCYMLFTPSSFEDQWSMENLEEIQRNEVEELPPCEEDNKRNPRYLFNQVSCTMI